MRGSDIRAPLGWTKLELYPTECGEAAGVALLALPRRFLVGSILAAASLERKRSMTCSGPAQRFYRRRCSQLLPHQLLQHA